MNILQLLVLGMARQDDEFKELLGRVPLEKVELLILFYYKTLEVWGPVGPRLLGGGPSGRV